MALMFHRTVAMPACVWAIAFFTVALATPPPAAHLLPPILLLVIALAGIAVIAFAMPRAFPWLRTSRSLARVTPSACRDKAGAGRLLVREQMLPVAGAAVR